MKWQLVGNTFYPAVEAKVEDFPLSGIYQIIEVRQPGGTVIGLRYLCDKFTFSHKIYDLGTNEIQNRVLKTWSSEYFKNLNKNLGVAYNGLKGTGKTIAAKILCNEINLPVLIINSYFDGLLEFIQSSIDFDCIIFIDEAEKVFSDSEGSTALLRMIDGVINSSRKLFILTTNNLTIDDNLLDRPSRIRYIKEFGNVSSKAIDEILKDKLIDKSQEGIIKSEIEKLTFTTVDIIDNLISEFNIHGNLLNDNVFNIPCKSYNIPTLNINVDSIYVEQKLIDINTIVELSKKISPDNKLKFYYDVDDVLAKDIIIDIEKEIKIFKKEIDLDNFSLEDFILEFIKEKAGINTDNNVGCYRTYFRSWTPNIYVGLKSDDGSSTITEIKSNCIKVEDHYKSHKATFNILL